MKTKIYSLQDEMGQIRYIGKTTRSLNYRFSLHLWDARHGIENDRCDWIRSILSHGKWPSIFLIGEVEGNGINEERAWIKYFKDEGVNLVNGNDGGSGNKKGYKPTKETIDKIAQANTGKTRSSAICKKMSEAQSKVYYSPERRERIRTMGRANAGRIKSPEELEKFKKTTKERHSLIFTPQRLEQVRQLGYANRGRAKSPETCQKIRESKKGTIPWNKGIHIWDTCSHPKGMLGKKQSQATIQKRIETMRVNTLNGKIRKNARNQKIGQKK
jgi:hypothetical protein